MSSGEKAKKPAVVVRLEELFAQGKMAATDLIAEAELNMAFLGGDQWVCWSRGLKSLSPVENSLGEERVIDNKMLAHFQKWHGQFFRQKPVVVGYEGAPEVEDAQAASAASTLFDYWMQNCGWKQAEQKALSWLALTGIAFFVPCWRRNDSRRDKVQYQRLSDKPRRGKTGGKTYLELAEKEIATADVAVEWLNPLSTYTFPLDAQEWSKVQSVLHASVETLEWLRQKVDPDLPEDLEPVLDVDLNRAALTQLRGLRMSGTLGVTEQATEGVDSGKRHLYLQYWERPSKERPNGRHLVVVGGRLVVDEELPYAAEARLVDPHDARNLTMGIVPLTLMDWPAGVVPPAPLTQWRPYQMELNELRTDQRQNRRMTGRNKLLIEKGQVAKDQWTDEHGEIIEYERSATNAQPQWVQGMPLVGIDREIQQAEAKFEEATGLLEVLRGENPTQVRSAQHFAMLREEANGGINVQLHRREEVMQTVGQMLLAIAQKRYSKDRFVAVCGMENTENALALAACRPAEDLRLEIGSTLPRNKALVEATLTERLRDGAFMDPQTSKPRMDLYWRMMGLGSLTRSVDPAYAQKVFARNENALMANRREPIHALPWQDHNAHMDEHQAFMSTERFSRLGEAEQALFIAHLQSHARVFAAAVAPQALEARPSDMEPVTGLAEILRTPPGGEAGAPMPPPPGPGPGPGMMLPPPQAGPPPAAPAMPAFA